MQPLWEDKCGVKEETCGQGAPGDGRLILTQSLEFMENITEDR